MPSRWVCVAIVAFWLGTNGWLLWKDVWPNLQPGQPPPFTIDLVEEVQFDKPPQTPWTVTVAGHEKETYRASTWVEREPGGDLYVLNLHVVPSFLAPQDVKGLSGRLVQSMDSQCRVTPAGHLRGLEAEVTVIGEVKASFRGEVRGDSFFGHYGVTFGGQDVGKSKWLALLGKFIPRTGDLDPVPVAHDGAVFLPFHPAPRYHGLRAGQSWRVPSLDLLPVAGRASVRFLDAHVLPAPRTLPWKGKESSCLVIEYADDDTQVQTWVEQDSGLVLRQDAVVGTEHWVLQRDR
jgi:hypothetical protein